HDRGAGGDELVGLFGEGMGFQITAAGIGARIEVDHDRTFLEGVLEMEGGVLAPQAPLGGEVGRHVAGLEGGKGGRGGKGGQKAQYQILFHWGSPQNWAGES